MVSGLFHGLVYLVDGGGWEGPLSWRKPTVFGLSFGITLITLTWFLGFLRPSRWAGWTVVGILSVASLGEVFPHLDADLARGRLALQRVHAVRRRGVQPDGHARHDPGRDDRPDHGVVIRPARRPAQPPTRDPARPRPHAGQPGGRRADDRGGRQHVRQRGGPQGASRLDPPCGPAPARPGHRAAGLGVHGAAQGRARGSRSPRVRGDHRLDDGADLRGRGPAGPHPALERARRDRPAAAGGERRTGTPRSRDPHPALGRPTTRHRGPRRPG